MSKFFTREEILSAQDLPSEDVIVPEWGGKTVRIKGLSAKAAMSFASRMVKTDSKGKVTEINIDSFMAELIIATAVDPETEKPIFSMADVEALNQKSAMVLKRLSDIAARKSGLSQNAVEEKAKNSERTPGVDSLTA